MKKFLLYMVMFLLAGASAKAQNMDTIVIGQGTSTHNYPLPGYYGWNREAILYKADEIGMSGLVSKIAFYVSTANSNTTNRSIKIYVMQTDVNQLTTSFFPSWNTVKNQAVLVYDSTGIAFPATGWYDFELDNLFPYSVAQNLLVLIEGIGCTASGSCSPNCYYTSTPNMAWYGRKDSSAPNDSLAPASAYSSTNITANRSNIRIILEDTSVCKNIINLTASNVTARNALIKWQSRGDETNWVLAYKARNENDWSADIPLTDTLYDFSGSLYPNTTYEVKVAADCGGSLSVPLIITFTTTAACFPPTDITISNIASDHATIFWNDTAHIANYNIVVSLTSISNFDTITPVNVTDTFYIANNLSPNTLYYVYLQTDCGQEDGISSWSSVKTFRTECTPIDSFPWAYNFPNTTFPDCWSRIDSDNDGSNWGITAYTGRGNLAYSYSYYYFPLTPDNYLITPLIAVNTEYLILSFDVGAADQTDFKEKYSVMVSTTGSNPANFVPVHTETLSNPNFKRVNIPLSDYYGDSIHIAFRHWDCTDQYALLLDSISIQEVGGSDLAIVSIDYPNSGVLTSSDSITITFENRGITPFNNFEVNLEVDSVFITSETISETILGLQTYTYTFTADADFSAIGAHYIKVYLNALSGDTIQTNDTIAKVIVNYGEGVTLRGYRSTTNPRGVINFNSSSPGTVNVESTYTDGSNSIVAGEHVNGIMYLYSWYNPYGIPENFIRLSTADWSVLSSTPISWVPSDMTYDYTTNTMYGIGYVSSSSSTLHTIDMLTGAHTQVGTLNKYFATIACDIEGNMYGVTYEGLFCSIDKNTFNITVLDTTDLYPESYFQSMAFEHNSGRLFHAYLSLSENGLIEYDPITGSVIQNTGDIAGARSQFLAIHGIFNPVFPEAYTPEDGATDVDINTEISVKFNAPVSADQISSIYMIPDPGGVVGTVIDSTLYIAHNPLEYDTLYTVVIPDSALAEILGTFSWSFSTRLDPNACNDPTLFVVDDVEVFQATLSWQENGRATAWNIEYGPAGFTQGDTTGTLLTSIPNNPYTLSGLTHNTRYDVYVQSACSGNEESGWVGPLTFQTLYNCPDLVETFPWKEGFEDVNGTPAHCWTVLDVDGTGTKWNRNTSTSYIRTGSGSATHAYSSSANQNGWLITPRILIPDDGESYQLTFWSYNSYSSFYEKNSVLISTHPVADSLSSFVEKWSPSSVTSSWVRDTIDLSGFAGDTIYIAFRYEGDDAHSWYLDDIYIGTPLAQITSRVPAIGATNIALDTTVSVTFNINVTEDPAILANTTISSSMGAVTGVIATVNNNEVTIAHDNFEYEKTYTVRIPAGALNNYQDAISWSFTSMPDPTPILMAYSPNNAGTNILRTAPVSVKFDRNINPIASVLANAKITYGPGNTEVSGVVASVSDSAIVMTHADFEYATTYTVTIPAGAIQYYSQPISWSFTTMSLEATSISPDSNATNVSLNQIVNVVFNDNVTGVPSELANVKITYGSGTELTGVNASVNTNTLTIAHNGFEYGTTYTVNIPTGAIQSYGQPISWSFTTKSLEVVSVTPDSNATNVSLDQAVSVVFNDNVTGVAAELANVKIIYGSGIELTGVSASVNTNTLTIAHDDFEYETTYTVTIPAGAIQSYNQPISWSFTSKEDVGLDSHENYAAKIYPNPSNGTVYVEVTEKSTIKIYDLTGKLLDEYEADAKSRIHFSQSAGIYFVKVENKDHVSTHKVIIQ